ncbi:unnamed protein product [Timema podura]|uniref:Uncharacterized protein n=1 Tax=Timema podura TaxID=61482 RepID=A0ABN7NT00_TIMPD|nr:unnamed protein product [Timema podura]
MVKFVIRSKIKKMEESPHSKKGTSYRLTMPNQKLSIVGATDLKDIGLFVSRKSADYSHQLSIEQKKGGTGSRNSIDQMSSLLPPSPCEPCLASAHPKPTTLNLDTKDPCFKKRKEDIVYKKKRSRTHYTGDDCTLIDRKERERGRESGGKKGVKDFRSSMLNVYCKFEILRFYSRSINLAFVNQPRCGSFGVEFIHTSKGISSLQWGKKHVS